MVPLSVRLTVNIVLSAAILTVWLALTASATQAASANFFTTTHVNMRAGPGTSHRVVDTVPDKQIVTVTGCNTTLTWCRVEWDSADGWLSSKFITRPAPVGSFSLQAEILDIPIVDFERNVVIEPAAAIDSAGATDVNRGRDEDSPVFVIYANQDDATRGSGTNHIAIPERTAVPIDQVIDEPASRDAELLGADLG